MTPDAITPEILLRGYASGIFPMAESRDAAEIHWVDPRRRGIIPLDGFHISRSLRRRILRCGWEVRVDTAFAGVVEGCAERDETWINDQIIKAYNQMHVRGHAHSIECWSDGQLVGGLYGLAMGRAFFGESMFHRATDASKVALMHLAARLRAGGFKLLDTQFITPHLATLGAVEVPRETYHVMLDDAIGRSADFFIWPKGTHVPGEKIIEILKA